MGKEKEFLCSELETGYLACSPVAAMFQKATAVHVPAQKVMDHGCSAAAPLRAES